MRNAKRNALESPDGEFESQPEQPYRDYVARWWPLQWVPALTNELTQTEAAVAELAAKGFTNTEIARARGRSARTIENQLASIYRKLRVGSRTELAAYIAGTIPRRARR